MTILGVRVDNISRKEILEKIESFLSEDRFHQIATVNPEFILAAQKDKKFKNILNTTDLNIADGVGIWYAFIRFGGWLKTRIAGVDLTQEILRIADKKKLSVFLAITKNGFSSYKEVHGVLSKNYPNIKFSGESLDPLNFFSYNIRNTKYEILFCNFGAPYQERFIQSVKNDTIRLAIGIGGSFDFITGKIKRAPKIMRIFGLEWLWRLILEPKYRFRRIINAVIIFPIKVLFSR